MNEPLYFFEIKHQLAGESNSYWITVTLHKVATTAKDLLINWDYLEAVSDVVLFVFS